MKVYLKKGSIVQLKSGGPKMISEEAKELPNYLSNSLDGDENQTVKCYWHDGDRLRFDLFPLFLLTEVTE